MPFLIPSVLVSFRLNQIPSRNKKEQMFDCYFRLVIFQMEFFIWVLSSLFKHHYLLHNYTINSRCFFQLKITMVFLCGKLKRQNLGIFYLFFFYSFSLSIAFFFDFFIVRSTCQMWND